MLSRYRRGLFVFFFLLVWAPLIFGLVAPQSALIPEKEKRPLSAAPSWPVSFQGLSTIPSKLEAFLSDRIGLRSEMIRLYANLDRRLLRSGTSTVLVGSDDHFFYKLDNAVLQSTGIVPRNDDVGDTVRLLAEMRDKLEQLGIKFVVAFPPNAASIDYEALPRWLRNRAKITEYDTLLEGLRLQHVTVVDLRSPLTEAKNTGKVYFLHDTHWTPRGAIIGFNSIVEATGRPEWKLDVNASLLEPMQRRGGDLAQMIGLEEDVTESVQNLSLSPSPEIVLPSEHQFGDSGQPPFSETGRPRGETLLLIGDSFTRWFFPPLLISHVGRFVWMH